MVTARRLGWQGRAVPACRHLCRSVAGTVLSLLLLGGFALPVAAQGTPETLPAGDPSPPVALLVAAGVVGGSLVIGGITLLVVGRRNARAGRPTDGQGER